MEKVFTYMFITIGILILFNVAGLVPDLGSTVLGRMGLSSAEDLNNFSTSGFMIRLVAAIAAITGLSAIIIGSLGRASFETSIAGGFASAILIYFIYSLASISYYTYSAAGSAWVGVITFAIATPLILTFAVALFDWVRGRD